MPCSHYSPSTFINKLPLITAVIAKLFHSSNYSSQPNPGYLSRALSPKMAPSQLIYSPGFSLCCAVPKWSTPGWQLRVGGALPMPVGVRPQCGTLCVWGTERPSTGDHPVMTGNKELAHGTRGKKGQEGTRPFETKTWSFPAQLLVFKVHHLKDDPRSSCNSTRSRQMGGFLQKRLQLC